MVYEYSREYAKNKSNAKRKCNKDEKHFKLFIEQGNAIVCHKPGKSEVIPITQILRRANEPDGQSAVYIH